MANGNNAHWFSSESNDWATPQDFFDNLNNVYRFTLDPCASPSNAKCARYFTESDDGLQQDWAQETVFMNPPYGRGIGKWIKKAYEASLRGATVVCLIPARTDTAAWHEYIFGKAKVQFVRGRLKFGNAKDNAPFPSAVVTYLAEGK